jgi:hypothetical protein
VWLSALAGPQLVHAAGPDPRLASAKTVWIIAVDELGDDRPVATCLSQHITTALPVAVAEDVQTADLLLRVSAHLPGRAAREGLGVMGGRPSGHLTVEAHGTKLWEGGAKVGSGWSWEGVPTAGSAGQTLACEVADELLDTLKNAMRKARSK